MYCITIEYKAVHTGGRISSAISVRLSDEIASEMGEIARETNRSKSYLMQKAIEAYLERTSDLQVYLDRLQDPTDKVISQDEMKKNPGL